MHMMLTPKKIVGLLLWISAMGASPAYAFYEDFQLTTPGSRPGNAVYSGSSQVEVVGGTNDPFGISGNQSIRLWQATSSLSRMSWTDDSAGYSPLSEGVISFDYYVEDIGSGAKKTNIYFTQGTSPGGDFDAFRILIDDVGQVGRIRLSNGATYNPVTNYAIQFDTAYSFEVIFQDSEYEVYVKEYGVADYTQLAIGSATTFSYHNAGMEISMLQFTPASSSVHKPFYVDNISIIPEANTYGMISAAGLILWVAVRRFRGKRA